MKLFKSLSIAAVLAGAGPAGAWDGPTDLIAYAAHAARNCEDMELDEKRAWDYLNETGVQMSSKSASLSEVMSSLAFDGPPSCWRAWDDFGADGFRVKGLLRRPIAE